MPESMILRSHGFWFSCIPSLRRKQLLSSESKGSSLIVSPSSLCTDELNEIVHTESNLPQMEAVIIVIIFFMWHQITDERWFEFYSNSKSWNKQISLANLLVNINPILGNSWGPRLRSPGKWQTLCLYIRQGDDRRIITATVTEYLVCVNV